MALTVGGLKRRREFLLVAAARRKWVAPGLILQARERRDRDRVTVRGGGVPPDIRVGFTASRKVGGAVVRNRARRRLRHAVRQVMPGHAAPGNDYVVIARAATARRRFPDLVSDLLTALKRLDAYRDDDKETST